MFKNKLKLQKNSLLFCFIKLESKFALSRGEGVGTSKIRTSKGQNFESIFWMIRTSKITLSKTWSKITLSKRMSKVKNDFWRSDLFWRHRYYQKVKSFGSFSSQKYFRRSDFTYGVRCNVKKNYKAFFSLKLLDLIHSFRSYW